MIISLVQIEIYLLIVARIGGSFIDAPLFSAKSIPTTIKTAAVVWLSAIMWFVIPIKALPDSVPAFIFALLMEVFIGYTIGFVSGIVLQSAQASGDLLDMQMGLSVANVLSPTTGEMTSITGTLIYMIAILTFLLIDGHHMVLAALHQSFIGIPLVTAIDFSKPNLFYEMINLLRFFWVATVQLCAPMLLLIFLMDFSFGIVSRVAPQVNVFMLGFQVKPTLGLFGFMLISPLIISHMISLITKLSAEITNTIVILSGR